MKNVDFNEKYHSVALDISFSEKVVSRSPEVTLGLIFPSSYFLRKFINYYKKIWRKSETVNFGRWLLCGNVDLMH